VPVAAALALGTERGESAAAGLWGAFVAYYATEWFGAFGAWLLVVFGACALLVATLAWNPVRAFLAGRYGAPDPGAALADASMRGGRRGRLR
jgi:hypothetical protein